MNDIIAGYMVPHPPVIIPEVGRGEERVLKATTESFQTVAKDLAEKKPDLIVFTSPHATMYADYFHISPGEKAAGDFNRFGAGEVKFEETYDQEFVSRLSVLCEDENLPAGTDGERDPTLDHGVMVPLYFIRKEIPDVKIIRIGLSGLSLEMHYKLGQLIARVAEELHRRTAFVASGDLSHCQLESGPYGYQEEGPEYDRRIMDCMGRGAFDELFDFEETFLEKAQECGHRSFVIMAGAFDRVRLKIRKLSHEATFGVGYGFCIFEPDGEDPDRNFAHRYREKIRERIEQRKNAEDDYIRLARTAIEAYIKNREVIEVPRGLPPEMLTKKAGTFVSIHEDGLLRGCIGTTQATTSSIAEEIISNAISASTRDPRFSPIETYELDKLEISVDILGDLEKISSPAELNVKRYGVVVTNGMRRGLLLPNLEGVDTIEEQIGIAKRKAGIGEAESVELERFEVIRHDVGEPNV